MVSLDGMQCRNASADARTLPACDLVLKGGITSGVVYPGAIVRLSADYRFHQLGGTSAGAIAAAAAAAAELGHQSGKIPDAFAQLARLPQRLGAPVSAHSSKSVLLAMFRPTAKAERVFGTVIAAAGGGFSAPLRLILAAIRQYPLAALAGIAPALLGIWVSPLAADAFGRIIQALLASGTIVVGMLIALLVALLADIARVLPEQGWGLCAGVRRDAGTEDPQSLSSWLHGYFNELAGLGAGEVLTFGHLWQCSQTPADTHTAPEARRIVLKVMTTALSTQRPFSVPFETSDASTLYFRPEDLEDVLPARVIQHMMEHSQVSELFPLYRHLPSSNQLPVLLAVRMSLSFPFLLSAVRLSSPDFSRVDARDIMQPLWFSDGGICSNIPVHFFDSPIPAHPTFAINLIEPHPDADTHPDKRGRMAFANDKDISGSEGYRSYFHDKRGLEGIAAFTMAVVDSARNWVDASQMRLQDYRERIGNVVVRSDEGGLNLSMPEEEITALSARGADVAEDLHRVFTQPIWPAGGGAQPATGMQRYVWVRFRNQMGALATFFGKIQSSLISSKLSAADLQRMVEEHPGTNSSDDRDPAKQQALKTLIGALDTVVGSPCIADVKDKSNADFTLRPRY